jgi:hypothetical protein
MLEMICRTNQNAKRALSVLYILLLLRGGVLLRLNIYRARP